MVAVTSTEMIQEAPGARVMLVGFIDNAPTAGLKGIPQVLDALDGLATFISGGKVSRNPTPVKGTVPLFGLPRVNVILFVPPGDIGLLAVSNFLVRVGGATTKIVACEVAGGPLLDVTFAVFNFAFGLASVPITSTLAVHSARAPKMGMLNCIKSPPATSGGAKGGAATPMHTILATIGLAILSPGGSVSTKLRLKYWAVVTFTFGFFMKN